jgi:broad specificity phosphatase PhoE
MQKLYLIRHGQTDWNAQHRLQGHSDIPLNSAGEDQCQSLAQKIHHIHFDLILSSDLSRAVRTAEILNHRRGLPLRKTKKLREIHLGEIEGLQRHHASKILGQKFWDNWISNNKDSWNMKYPLGENKLQGYKRFEEALNSTNVQNLMIVSHGLMIRGFLNKHFPEQTQNLIIGNATALVLEKQNKKWLWRDLVTP